MTHQAYDDRRDTERLVDIVAADELHPGFGRQIINGITGLLVLLVTGIVVVLLVLWKAP